MKQPECEHRKDYHDGNWTFMGRCTFAYPVWRCNWLMEHGCCPEGLEYEP